MSYKGVVRITDYPFNGNWESMIWQKEKKIQAGEDECKAKKLRLVLTSSKLAATSIIAAYAYALVGGLAYTKVLAYTAVHTWAA